MNRCEKDSGRSGISQWVRSANCAIEGVLHAAKTQRHLKFHLIAAFFVLLFCFAIGVEKYDFVLITIAALLVIMAEMFNTAVENTVDLLEPEKNEIARIAKDISAGAVLVVASGAVIVGYLVLWPYFKKIITGGFRLHRTHFPENIAILALIITMLLIILIKASTGKGLPLHGGFPSGHSAMVFSMWLSLTHLTDQIFFVIGGLILAVLVSLFRLIRGIHTLKEIATGAMLGCLITYLLFFLFHY